MSNPLFHFPVCMSYVGLLMSIFNVKKKERKVYGFLHVTFI
jgi:hypothetical protein